MARRASSIVKRAVDARKRKQSACGGGYPGASTTLLVTPADEQDRARVGHLAHAVQEATGHSVEIAFACLMLHQFMHYS